MSVGAIVFPAFQRWLDSKDVYDWAGDNLRVALLDTAPHLADELFSQVADREIKNWDYKRGGKRLRNQHVRIIGNVAGCSADSITWRTWGIRARHAVVYRDDHRKPLVAWVDFGEEVVAKGWLSKANLKITWDPRGVIELTHPCCLRFPHEVQR